MRTQLGQDSESMELRLFPTSLTLKLSQTDAENVFSTFYQTKNCCHRTWRSTFFSLFKDLLFNFLKEELKLMEKVAVSPFLTLNRNCMCVCVCVHVYVYRPSSFQIVLPFWKVFP